MHPAIRGNSGRLPTLREAARDVDVETEYGNPAPMSMSMSDSDEDENVADRVTRGGGGSGPLDAGDKEVIRMILEADEDDDSIGKVEPEVPVPTMPPRQGTYRAGAPADPSAGVGAASSPIGTQPRAAMTLNESWEAVRALGQSWELVLGGTNHPVVRGRVSGGSRNPIAVAARISNLVQRGGPGTKIGVNAETAEVTVCYVPQRPVGLTTNDFAVLEQINVIVQRAG
jgi:hypothetical protein